jgi:fucokinase
VSGSNWDYLILTASNDQQAAAYEKQLGFRRRTGQLSRVRQTLVVADVQGKRIGSGGSTLQCLSRVLQLEAAGSPSGAAPAADADVLSRLRILILHAGGDSRRLPAYGPCGKIFVPLPGESGTALPLALFDELAPAFLDLPPGPDGRGQIVVAAGDALIRFDRGALALDQPGVIALAAWATPEEAARHGVFCLEGDTGVRLYLQKPSLEEQEAHGAISAAGRTALDIGVMSLDGPAAAALLEIFVPFESLILEHGADLYREVCCALGRQAILDHYVRTASGSGSKWPWAALAGAFSRLRQLEFAARLVPSCEFLHFGSTRQLVSSGRIFAAAPAAATLALNNEITGDGAIAGTDSWVEGCRIHAPLTLGGRNVVTGTHIAVPLTLPPGACLDVVRRARAAQWFVRCYGSNDTFKHTTGAGGTLANIPLDQWMDAAGISEDQTWDAAVPETERTLWNARVIPAITSPRDYAAWLWMFAPNAATDSQRRAFVEAERFSAADLALLADQDDFHDQRAQIRAHEVRRNLTRLLAPASRFSAADLAFTLEHSGDPAGLLADLLDLYRKPLAPVPTTPPPKCILPAASNIVSETAHGTRKRVIVRSGVLPSITQVAIAEFFTGADVIEPHSHFSMWEVYFVLEGKVRYRGGDEEGIVGPGDTVLVPPGTLHELHPVETPYRMFYWGLATAPFCG